MTGYDIIVSHQLLEVLGRERPMMFNVTTTTTHTTLVEPVFITTRTHPSSRAAYSTDGATMKGTLKAEPKAIHDSPATSMNVSIVASTFTCSSSPTNSLASEVGKKAKQTHIDFEREGR